MKSNICSVLVTYNRLADLKKTLKAYVAQTLRPDYLIIVDNASTDGTTEFVDEWSSKHQDDFQILILHSEKNLGGAGGFSLGIKKALELESDFVFLADDDATPYEDMFEKLIDYYSNTSDKESIAALCTAVIDQYGFSGIQRGRIKKGIISIGREKISQREYQAETLDVDLLTFVGALIKKSTIQRIGLPLAEYFIHEDDAEYSTRIRKVGRIVCVTSSKIHHLNGGLNVKNWVEYYTTRNYIDYIGRHYPNRYVRYAILDKYIKKCSIVASLLRHRSKEFRKMNLEAIKDGKYGKLGISEKYYPGINIR